MAFALYWQVSKLRQSDQQFWSNVLQQDNVTLSTMSRNITHDTEQNVVTKEWLVVAADYVASYNFLSYIQIYSNQSEHVSSYRQLFQDN